MAKIDPEQGVSLALGTISTLTLRNPGKRNALTWHMYDQLEAGIAEIRRSDEVRVVLIQGTLADGFAAGTDISQFAGFDGAMGLAYEERVGRVLSSLLEIEVPVIAAVQGAAVGAGLAIAACADIVIAERGSKFGAPIARTLGNCLPSAVIVRLRSRLGPALTDRILLTASLIPADELVGCGFVSLLSDHADFADTVSMTLTRVTRSAPLTLRAVKETSRRMERAARGPGNDDLIERCYGSRDFTEGVQAFLEHRHPEWRGI